MMSSLLAKRWARTQGPCADQAHRLCRSRAKRADRVVPLLYSFITKDAALYAYDKAIFITVISGLAMTLVSRKRSRELQVRD